MKHANLFSWAVVLVATSMNDSEPFGSAQDKLREESQRNNEILRRSAPQNDILPKPR
jgi:hypothetical protein